jgi:hypothetical protein
MTDRARIIVATLVAAAAPLLLAAAVYLGAAGMQSALDSKPRRPLPPSAVLMSSIR